MSVLAKSTLPKREEDSHKYLSKTVTSNGEEFKNFPPDTVMEIYEFPDESSQKSFVLNIAPQKGVICKIRDRHKKTRLPIPGQEAALEEARKEYPLKCATYKSLAEAFSKDLAFHGIALQDDINVFDLATIEDPDTDDAYTYVHTDIRYFAYVMNVGLVSFS